MRNNHSQDVVETISFDNLDRISSVSKTGYGIGSDIVTNYGYDASGNLTKKSDFSKDTVGSYIYGGVDRGSNNGAGPNAVKQVNLADKAFDIDAPNRVMTMKYDDNGNLTEKVISLNGNPHSANQLTYNAIVYNSDNKPTAITNYNGKTTTFEYGSDGMRYKQVTDDKTTYYIGGGSYEVEIDHAENDLKTTNAYIGDYALLSRSSDGKVKFNYLHKDRLGSIDTISDGTMAASNASMALMAIEQRTYNVFGKARTSTGGTESDGTEGNGSLNSDITQRGYTGHEHLAESGIIHMNGRAYDPDLGRFMSVDPFVAMPENGQSLNPYSYVMNNPLKYTDPSGYTPVDSVPKGCDDNCKKIRAEIKKKAKECNGSCVVKLVDGNGKEVDTYIVDNGASKGGGSFGSGNTSSAGNESSNRPESTGSSTNTTGSMLEVGEGIIKGAVDGQLATALDTPIGHPLYSQAGYTPTPKEICNCDFVSAFEPVQTNEEQLGRDLYPAVALVGILFFKRPGSAKVVTGSGGSVANGIAGLSRGQMKAALKTAQAEKKGSTVVGHALSKHAGRNPETWGKMSGSMKTWNDQAMKHFREIIRGPGEFKKVTSNGRDFLEKRLEDGRGMRLQMDSTFKTFID